MEFTFKHEVEGHNMTIYAKSFEQAYNKLVQLTKHPSDWLIDENQRIPTTDYNKAVESYDEMMLGEPLADDGPVNDHIDPVLCNNCKFPEFACQCKNDKDQDDLIAGDYEQFPPEKRYTFDDLDKNFSRL